MVTNFTLKEQNVQMIQPLQECKKRPLNSKVARKKTTKTLWESTDGHRQGREPLGGGRREKMAIE